MNEEQFNKFMEAMTNSASKEGVKTLPKENNLVKVKPYGKNCIWILERNGGCMVQSNQRKRRVLEKQFAPKEHQHHWQMELYELWQKDMEKVDIYATKFTKLLNRINVDNGFSDGFIVGMFLNGLKGNNATLVSVAAPKNLNEAITAAKRKEEQPKLEAIDIEPELYLIRNAISELKDEEFAIFIIWDSKMISRHQVEEVNKKNHKGYLAFINIISKSKSLSERERTATSLPTHCSSVPVISAKEE
ncbi:13407_t:CDS:2, partial [Gigaspora rosea]